MRLLIKILGGFVIFLLILCLTGLIYLESAFPKVTPAENIKIDITPQKLARGRYLTQHVVGCLGCHSDRDWNLVGGPIKEETLGKGGFSFNHQLMGLPGEIYAKNITPYHLKDWTDGELIRCLRNGLDKQGNALFPLMPYGDYALLTQEDLYSIVAYLRGLQPIAYTPPERRLDFPVNLIVKTMPQKAQPYLASDNKTNLLAYGHYLINASGCLHCHTPVDGHGNPLADLEAAGGMEFHWPDGSTVRSANITPDKKTGIGEWTRDYFIKRFKLGEKLTASHTPVKPGEINSPMPWGEYGGMTDEDLGAIYEYLHLAVEPVEHNVEKFTPANVQTASSE